MVTLLGEAIQRHCATETETGRQLTLWDEADRLPDDGEPGEIAGNGKGGRPPGAQNRATEAFRAFVRARYGDPLLRLMERTFADPLAMARLLGAEPWEVFKAQSEWMLRLMPYLHSAMPAELKVSSKGRLAVAIGSVPGGPSGDRMMAADPIQALVEFAQQNQGFSVTVEAQSNAAESNASEESGDGSKA